MLYCATANQHPHRSKIHRPSELLTSCFSTEKLPHLLQLDKEPVSREEKELQELIDAVKAWPVIVQGTLGSALFWLIMLCGQFLTSRISKTYSHHSKRARLSWLISAHNKHSAIVSTNDTEQTVCFVILIYRSSRHLLRALMWLVMGLIFQSLYLPAGIIGFCGSLYYLFKAYEIVSPIEYGEDSNAILTKINEEIEKLEKELEVAA